MSDPQLLTLDDWYARLPETGKGLVMYSSEWGGLVTDPRLMQVPVEDHLVHRGDGVFETLLAEEGAVYNLEAHLQRLQRSAEYLGISVPLGLPNIGKHVLACFRHSERDRALARLLLGRGSGGFGVNPAECPEASLYIIVYPAPPPFMETHPDGAKIGFSQVPPKSGGLARVKTCNYIPNALMKLEATERGLDFVIGLDADGQVTESFTENLLAVDKQGILRYPNPTQLLQGTTLQRVCDLAQAQGLSLEQGPISRAELMEMPEIMMVGTTAYVSRVGELEGKALPPSRLQPRLSELLQQDIRGNAQRRSPWS